MHTGQTSFVGDFVYGCCFCCLMPFLSTLKQKLGIPSFSAMVLCSIFTRVSDKGHSYKFDINFTSFCPPPLSGRFTLGRLCSTYPSEIRRPLQVQLICLKIYFRLCSKLFPHIPRLPRPFYCILPHFPHLVRPKKFSGRRVVLMTFYWSKKGQKSGIRGYLADIELLHK